MFLSRQYFCLFEGSLNSGFVLSNMGFPPVDQLPFVADLRSEQNILAHVSQLFCHLVADTLAYMIHG